MIDGRHTGTGGGNHVVVGGATPADSPFLRRPDLLQEPGASLAAPSSAFLSLLRPLHRADEPGATHRRGAARFLYELEIALAQVPLPGAGASRRCPGWSTGCSAICWSTSPATPTAPRSASTSSIRPIANRPPRAGRVPRLRDAAEPAHEPCPAAARPRDRSPACGKAADRRLRALGHRAARPLHAARISSGRISSTCLPTCAARFRPSAGMVRGPDASSASRSAARSITGASSWSCAMALEPWHVHGRGGRHRRHGALRRFLGRAPAGEDRGLRARAPSRWPATAAPLPMTRTEGAARPSPACASRRGSRATGLHPMLPVDAPLTFDIFDSWTGRALGGCVYHVAHPGGRNYETFPRQRQRSGGAPLGAFRAARPHAGRLRAPPEERNANFRMTLDLQASGRAVSAMAVPDKSCKRTRPPASGGLAAGYRAVPDVPTRWWTRAGAIRPALACR